MRLFQAKSIMDQEMLDMQEHSKTIGFSMILKVRDSHVSKNKLSFCWRRAKFLVGGIVRLFLKFTVTLPQKNVDPNVIQHLTSLWLVS